MRRVYYVNLSSLDVKNPALEILADDSVSTNNVIAWLREAVDCLSGDFRNCVQCGTMCFKHNEFICQTCGERAGLYLVK